MPGLGAALASIGFGAIVTFASLLFVARDWTPVWLAFTSYAVALIAARLLFGHLPDRIGGAKVALLFVLIETAGLALMGLASSAGMAAVGAVLTGLGYSLVFPGLGVEAVRRAPPESRGRGDGRLHGLPGPGPWDFRPRARPRRERRRPQRRVPRQRPCRARGCPDPPSAPPRTVGRVSASTGIHEARS